MTGQAAVSLSPEQWREVLDAVDRALELDVEARAAFVEQCCTDDPALGAELKALLDNVATPSVLDSSAAAFAGPLLAERSSEPDQLASAAELIVSLQDALGGRYAIERELGYGGMATVYLARDLKHEREVALKVLRPDLALAMSTERFLQEIRITARLNHPHILTLIDSGETDGFLWYVLPYIRGESLRDKLSREKQLGMEEALMITKQIVSALDYAHRHAVIHRDIKPENILLHEGEAMLADFGIALAVEEASGSRLSRTGTSPGTPQYMSPEQASGRREVDARSDVYSLAVVVYEMLTGTPPHTGATAQAIIAKVLAERPTPIRTVRDTVPESIDNAVAKALAKVPADRFAQVGEFADALSASTKSGSMWWPGAWSWSTTLRRKVAMAGIVVVAILVSLLVRDGLIGVQPAPARALYRQITGSGRATSPALSRNGQFLAFLDSGRLYVRSLAAGGSEVPVLSESEASRWGKLHNVEWSADGAKLFLYADSGTYVLPALGGTAQRVTRWGNGNFSSMSPGGDLVAEWHSGGMVRVRDLTSGAVDTVPVLGDYTWLMGVAWSPRSNALVVMTTDGQRRYTMRLLDLRRRNGRVLLEDSVPTRLIAWNGAAGAIYYVRRVYPIQLWKLPMSAAAGTASGQPVMVIPRLDGYEFSTADDGTLAFTRDAGVSNIWVGWVQGDTARRWLTTATTKSGSPRFSPDGQLVAFIREDGASANLFVAGTDSGAPQQLTFLNDMVGRPAWSPNGERIAFCHGYGDAAPGIGIVPAVGGPVVWLTTPRKTSMDCEVGWSSADEVLYHQVGNRNFGVVSLRGRPARRLVANDSVGWMFSAETDPAGRFVAIYWNWRGRDGIWLVSLADSSQRLLYPGHIMPLRWLATSDVLYARDYRSPFRLLRIPIAAPESTTTVPLLRPCPDGISDVSSDGSRIVCAEGTSASDIWLVRDFDPTHRPPRQRP